MSDQTPDWAHSFGSVADAYDRGRPSYPREAAAWLVGRDAATVLELGAGTGKLTEVLVGLGHDVHATDPDRAMLDVLEKRVPAARTAVAGAEDIPLADRSVDVVVAAQCFHWFDLDRALPEIARVLRPGGHVALVWNQRNERIPWVRRLGAIIGKQDHLSDPAEPLVQSALFGFVEDAQFSHWQQVDRRSIQDLVLSRSNIAVLDEAGRKAKLDEVLAFYDDYGRGMDGMQLPYDTLCFRAHVLDRPDPPRRTTADGDTPVDPVDPPTDKTDRPGGAGDDDGGDILLIDFR
ncbi:MAG: class I SAM-dependent methyltransferase [Nocardioides sp.]